MQIPYVLYRIIYAIVMFLTTVGNSLVIISVIKFPWLHTVTNMFVLMLSSYDFLMGLPLFVNRRIYESLNVTTDGAVRMCQSQLFIAIFTFWGNLMVVAIISLDRFIFIQYPLKYHLIITKPRAAALCVLSVVVSASGAGYVLGTNSRDMYIPCDFQNDVGTFKIMNLTLISAGTLVVATLYGKIAHVACKAAKVAPSGGSHVAEANQSHQGTQSKITKVMVMVLGVYITSYIVVLVADFAFAGRHEDLSLVLFFSGLHLVCKLFAVF